MENINNYLIIIVGLMSFYVCLMMYLKYRNRMSSFTPVSSGIPNVESEPGEIIMKPEKNIYETEDTRMQYPLLPPVNPNVRNRKIVSDIPANPNLYSNQDYSSKEYLLDTPPAENTNQLVYSGGDTQMIKVPLQYNYPYNEQLRSQDILITPYNIVKYGNC